ncbi:MAG: hypothetical protein PHN84_03245 [Desulfuromonadaceae bacterium]|nr:hypothetical protein [Desulfuromonadaceae bacterium]
MDEKILQWLGWEKDKDPAFFKFPKQGRTDAKFMLAVDVPKYSTSDAVAVTLLPVLTEKGFKCTLESCPSHHNLGGGIGYLFQISKETWKYSCLQPTISEAICQATVKLIESI